VYELDTMSHTTVAATFTAVTPIQEGTVCYDDQNFRRGGKKNAVKENVAMAQ
jgi:hypothetical protein